MGRWGLRKGSLCLELVILSLYLHKRATNYSTRHHRHTQRLGRPTRANRPPPNTSYSCPHACVHKIVCSTVIIHRHTFQAKKMPPTTTPAAITPSGGKSWIWPWTGSDAWPTTALDCKASSSSTASAAEPVPGSRPC